MRQYTAGNSASWSFPIPTNSARSPARSNNTPSTISTTTLDQFTHHATRNGAHVHFAADGDEAKRIILSIAKNAGCTRCIKSKTMVSEEINLAHALEAAGMDVVETDLGEFIVQISHDRPSHLVAPIVHKDRASIAKLFSEYFGTPYDEDAKAMTMQARKYLRDKFRRSISE